MKPVLIAGISIVNLALISYTVAIILQTRNKVIRRNELWFLTHGVIFDITSTVCMIISSGHFITLHGIIGYTSLAAMIADTAFTWRHFLRKGPGEPLSRRFSRWSRLAYFYWVLAYITGVVIVASR